MKVLREHLRDRPQDTSAITLFSRLAKELKYIEAAEALARLAEAIDDGLVWDQTLGQENATLVFEAGYRLIDMREYELAVVMLQRCLEEAPQDPTLNYELGFSLMSIGKFDEAVRHFEKARDHEADFDSVLNLSVCYSLTRDLRKAKKCASQLEKLSSSEEEKMEVAHRKKVIQRLDQLRWKQSLSSRDWVYSLYGSLLVAPEIKKKEAQTAPTAVVQHREETHSQIARTLLKVKGVLEGLRLTPEAIEFYSSASRPLAAVLARLLDVPLDSYKGPDRPDHAMLVLDWAPEIIGPHEVFKLNDDNRSIYAYASPAGQPLPVMPDMLSHLTDEIWFPWIRRSTIVDAPPGSYGEETENPDESIPEILERAWNMESDPEIFREVQDTVTFFADKLDLLVFSNADRFFQRPEFSAEIPSELFSQSNAEGA